jgi:hypothetical protein
VNTRTFAVVGVLLVAILVVVVDATAGFEWFHHLSGWHGWSWQGWNALVALGTISLAGGTVILAWKTKVLADESRNEAKAQSRPALVTTDEGVWMNDEPRDDVVVLRGAAYIGEDFLVLGVRNIGEGPAFNARFLCPPEWMPEHDLHTFAPRGDRGTLVLKLAKGYRFSVRVDQRFRVVVIYEDIALRAYYTSVTLVRESDQDELPRPLEVFAQVVFPDDEKPSEMDLDDAVEFVPG